MKPRVLSLLALAALLSGAALHGTDDSRPALLPAADIGRFARPVTTRSAEAQQFFNQGLALAYCFDHDNAIRSFEAAARLDPECAMAWWGIALACGPHINLPVVPPARAEKAWAALAQAQRFASRGTPVEQALIAAQLKRYANPQLAADRRPLDEAYATAMREVWRQFPQDADVGALFAEALMGLRPWDLWQPDGSPQPGTDEIVATLAAVSRLAPDHPQMLHLTIHALEASPNPAAAADAADRLRHRQPGLGHMLHMPSHIDVLLGRWEESIAANARAVAADRATRQRLGQPPGFLWLYMGHSRHMLAFGAMMSGQSRLALDQMETLLDELPKDEAWRGTWGGLLDYFGPMRIEVLVRFGRWDELLAEPEPAENLPMTRAMRHAGRAIAHAAKGDAVAARADQQAFAAARTRVPADAVFGNNAAHTILDVAEAMVDGEVLIREGRLADGITRLREAVAREAKVRYDEPPDWIIPVRHALGAALMTAGRYREAEQVFREDLKKWPDNGWSLYGLGRTLKHLGRADEAAALERKFAQVWAKADIQINTSCLCLPLP